MQQTHHKLISAPDIPLELIVFGLTMTVGLVVVFGTMVRTEIRRDDRSLSIFQIYLLVVVVLLGPTLPILSGGAIVQDLAIAGHSVSLDPPKDKLLVNDPYEELAWEAANAVPGLNLPDALAWERPIYWPLGFASVFVRGVMVLFVVGSIAALVKDRRVAWRRRSAETADQPSLAGTSD